MSAHADTNWTALGLPAEHGKNAFTALPPKAIAGQCAVKKRHKPKLSKVQQAAISLETPEERKARLQQSKRALDQQGRPRVDLAPRTVGAITIHSQADAAKTTRIKHGRSL
jgi:hypothetical protein